MQTTPTGEIYSLPLNEVPLKFQNTSGRFSPRASSATGRNGATLPDALAALENAGVENLLDFTIAM